MLSFTKKVLAILNEKLPPPQGAMHAFIIYAYDELSLTVALEVNGEVRFHPVIFGDEDLDDCKTPEEVVAGVLEALKDVGVLK